MNKKLKYIILGISITAICVFSGIYLLAKPNPNETATISDIATEDTSNTSISETTNENKTNSSTSESTNKNSNDKKIEANQNNKNNTKTSTASNNTNTANATQNSQNNYSTSDFNGHFYLKNGDGRLTTIQQDSSSLKFSISGKYSEKELITPSEGIARINENKATYKASDGSTIVLQKNNGTFFVENYDKNNNLTFQGAYLPD